ncbi:MAG: DUF4367 domain-containing protein [Theionarchaea archaeon]|nr:DUF4367 domain-containing protein [Theionarchaea archaeon]
MEKKWAVAGIIGMLLLVSISLLHQRGGSEPIQAPCHTPGPPAPMEDTMISVQEAQEKVPFKIIEPKYLPTGFRFLGVHMYQEEVTLLYELSNGRRITISEWNDSGYEHQPYPGERNVIITGVEGWFSIPGPYNLLWNCNGLIISINADLSGGREVAMDEMIKIAESMHC